MKICLNLSKRNPMGTFYMFMMRLYGIKRLEIENNGRVVLVRYKFLASHKKALGGRAIVLLTPGLADRGGGYVPKVSGFFYLELKGYEVVWSVPEICYT